MKIIYLILTFAILYINTVEVVGEPHFIGTEGHCNKEICVSKCSNDADAECVENWTYFFFFDKQGVCKCSLPQNGH
uniref:Uncharacterized protein n=1 Tax=Strongyloides papillosus TaxID=174720 RepID=A0A0N5BZN6_STREA